MSEKVQQKDNFPSKGNQEKLILLLLKKDLRKKFMSDLVDRLFDLDVTVAVDKLSRRKTKKILLDT